LAKELVRAHGVESVNQCFGMVFEVRKRNVRATMCSLPGGPDMLSGPDVSEVASIFEGWGRRHHAVFTVTLSDWQDMWMQPEPILWDIGTSAPGCLRLACGDLVYVSHTDQRFQDCPFDSWSWGYLAKDPSKEGWFPTLAHTLWLVCADVAASNDGVKEVQAGDLIVAEGQYGDFLWGWKFRPGCGGESKEKGWFPRVDAMLEPISGISARAVVFPEGV
jgi:hypothetical protein